MTQIGTPTYQIERSSRRCAVTGRALEPGEAYMATLVEQGPETAEDAKVGGTVPRTGANPGANPGAGSPGVGAPWRRVDVSMEAWGQGSRPEHLFGFWKTRVPTPTEKKKLFISDELLMDLFLRLEGREDTTNQAFRFVLGLILMRKRLLVYEGNEERRGGAGESVQEWWTMRVRGGTTAGQRVELLNPQLDEGQVAAVSEQLGQVLEEEL